MKPSYTIVAPSYRGHKKIWRQQKNLGAQKTPENCGTVTDCFDMMASRFDCCLFIA